MKLELAAMVDGNHVVSVYVGIPRGVYAVHFDNKHVCFEEGTKLSGLFQTGIMMVSRFGEQDLIPKENFPGVLCFPCGTLTVGKDGHKKIIMEYIDTTNGPIKRHNHPEGIVEVYLSADQPYHGEVCGLGEFHNPFCNHTIAVKVI